MVAAIGQAASLFDSDGNLSYGLVTISPSAGRGRTRSSRANATKFAPNGKPFWVMNNWQDIDSCFGTPPEPLSTRCGGQGVVIFYGMAKPVRAPQIGPAHSLT